MREKQSLIKGLSATVDPRIHRSTRQGLQRRQDLFRQRQRHQSRAGFGEPEAKLFGDLIAKPRRPHFGDRFAPGRHHQRRGHHPPARGVDQKSTLLRHTLDFRLKPKRYACIFHLRLKHGDNLSGRSVTEKLPQRLFMPGNPRSIDPRDEIPLGKALERRQGKARIF